MNPSSPIKRARQAPTGVSPPSRALPGRIAPRSVGGDRAVPTEAFEHQPNGLVAHARQRRPDVSHAERSGRMVQHVPPHSFLLGPTLAVSLRPLLESLVRPGERADEEPQPRPRISRVLVPTLRGVQ